MLERLKPLEGRKLKRSESRKINNRQQWPLYILITTSQKRRKYQMNLLTILLLDDKTIR